MFNKYNGLLLIALIIAAVSCKKYDGDSYNFSNSVNDYIAFTPEQYLVINGETADTVMGTDTFYYYVSDADEQAVSIESRMAFPEDIQYTYSISVDNGATTTYQGTLPKFTSSTMQQIASEWTFPSGVDSLTGVIELVSATGPTKGNLVVGYPPGVDTKINFVVYNTEVYHPY